MVNLWFSCSVLLFFFYNLWKNFPVGHSRIWLSEFKKRKEKQDSNSSQATNNIVSKGFPRRTVFSPLSYLFWFPVRKFLRLPSHNIKRKTRRKNKNNIIQLPKQSQHIVFLRTWSPPAEELFLTVTRIKVYCLSIHPTMRIVLQDQNLPPCFLLDRSLLQVLVQRAGLSGHHQT